MAELEKLIRELYQLFDVDPNYLTRSDFFKLLDVITKIVQVGVDTYTREEIDAMYNSLKTDIDNLKPLIYAGL